MLQKLFNLVDNEDPVLNCPEHENITTEPGKPTSLLEWESPTATDNSKENVTITCDPASGSNFTIGQTSVTCTAVDAYGNSNNCIFYLDVKGKSIHGKYV